MVPDGQAKCEARIESEVKKSRNEKNERGVFSLKNPEVRTT